MDFKEVQKSLRGVFMPAQRRVRVEFGGEMIADSVNVMLLRDSASSLHYFFPEEDVNMDRLEETDHSTHSGWRGDTRHWTVTGGGQSAENAAWTYASIPEGRPDTSGYITFDWDAMDHWYVEDEEIFGHPRDPFHRVDERESTRHIRVEIDGVTVADSKRPVIVFETGMPVRYYLPVKDVKMDLLTPNDTSSICPYKGTASYWTVTVNGEAYKDHVWGYKKGNALPEVPRLEGKLSFYNEKMDIYVDGNLEERP